MRKISTLSAIAALACTLLLSGCASNSEPVENGLRPSGGAIRTGPPASSNPSAPSTALPPPPSPTSTFSTAKNASTRSDLANLKGSIKTYAASHGGQLPKTMDQAIATYNPGVSSDTQIIDYEVATDVSPNAFCLIATAEASTIYTITSNTEATGGGLCPPDHKDW